MLKQNSKKPTTKSEFLNDINLSGSDWTSIIKEEIQAALNQRIAEEECDFTSSVVIIVFLAILAVLIAAMGLLVIRVVL